MRSIAVVTGSRAEFGMLEFVIKEIEKRPDLDNQLIVSGMHLLEGFGNTILEISEKGYEIDGIVPMYGHEQNRMLYTKSLATALTGMVEAIDSISPSIVLILGDRLEPFAACLAASTLNMPVAHVHGGDNTDSGHLDNAIRHSISRFAHVHFPATKKSKRRLEMMGEESWRIHLVGSPAIDRLIAVQGGYSDALKRRLGFSENRPFGIFIFHGTYLEQEEAGPTADLILGILGSANVQMLIVYPNNDPGNRAIIEAIEKHKEKEGFIIRKNLEHKDFISLMAESDFIIGNTSSGIIEAPTFGVPFVHVGIRNIGREHGENVIFVQDKEADIRRGIEIAVYDKEFREKAKRAANPYGDGRSAKRIVDVLKNIEIDRKLLRKRITI